MDEILNNEKQAILLLKTYVSIQLSKLINKEVVVHFDSSPSLSVSSSLAICLPVAIKININITIIKVAKGAC